MHLERHRQMLREATAETLPAVEAQIREENPDAFLVISGEQGTLSQRKFFDEPCGPIPMASFVRAYVPPPPPTDAEAAPASGDDKEAEAQGPTTVALAEGGESNAEVEAAPGLGPDAVTDE